MLVLLDDYGAGKSSLGTDSEPSFIRRGSHYDTIHPTMIKKSFPVKKGAKDFRVFVLGGSQAMGSPYVQQRSNILSGRIFGFPNEGGISTWLERYLQRLFPDHFVQVINAAKVAHGLAASVETLNEIAEIGQPDLVVILSGNNERNSSGIGRDWMLSPGADLDAVLAELTRNFEHQVDLVVDLAQAKEIPVYFLTVPTNLRDWLPQGDPRGLDVRRILSDIEKLGPQEVLTRLRVASPRDTDDPVRLALRAKCYDAMGDHRMARALYVRAKDRDRGFLRARSQWNDIIRRIRSPNVRVIDMENILSGYARDGIPGEDLFHDYCHLVLAANRIVAFEIAKRLREDRGLKTGPVRLMDVKMDDFIKRQVRWLYWVKARKWLRARYFSVLSEVMILNAQATAARYWRESGDVDKQIGLMRSAERPSP